MSPLPPRHGHSALEVFFLRSPSHTLCLHRGPFWTALDGLLRPALLSTDPDGQLYSVEPVQDEEPPACADEFDDFVTYEASAFLTTGSPFPLPLHCSFCSLSVLSCFHERCALCTWGVGGVGGAGLWQKPQTFPTGLIGPGICMVKSHLLGLLWSRGLWVVRLCGVPFYQAEAEHKTLKVSPCELKKNCRCLGTLTKLPPALYPLLSTPGETRIVLCGVS